MVAIPKTVEWSQEVKRIISGILAPSSARERRPQRFGESDLTLSLLQTRKGEWEVREKVKKKLNPGFSL